MFQDSVNKSDVDEKTKATMMLCYGYVTLFAPSTLITSRLETSIMKMVTPQFVIAKVCTICHVTDFIYIFLQGYFQG